MGAHRRSDVQPLNAGDFEALKLANCFQRGSQHRLSDDDWRSPVMTREDAYQSSSHKQEANAVPLGKRNRPAKSPTPSPR